MTGPREGAAASGPSGALAAAHLGHRGRNAKGKDARSTLDRRAGEYLRGRGPCFRD